MYLAEALDHYFRRSKGKIVRGKEWSLNGLAIAMWECSMECGIDASILSKAINGKRLLTPRQLSVFCSVLGIKGSDREYLFYCLHKDQCLKGGAAYDSPFISSSGTQLFIDALMRQADSLFRAGKWRDLYDLSGILEAYLQGYVATVYRHNADDPLILMYQKVLYLRAKGMGSMASQDTIMRDTQVILQALQRYCTKASAHLVAGYAASFEATAYRILGIYPSARNAAFNPKSAVMSRRCAAKALEILPPTDNEYLASLRNIMDSSIALGEQGVFVEYLKVAKRIAPMQPPANFLSTIQLAGTVGKGMAVFKLGDPFALKAKMEKHFDRTLTGTKVYELSGIKTDLEIYVALKSAKDAHISQSIQRALVLADEESVRYKGIILRLAEQLR